jgi:hypothetical protein
LKHCWWGERWEEEKGVRVKKDGVRVKKEVRKRYG